MWTHRKKNKGLLVTPGFLCVLGAFYLIDTQHLLIHVLIASTLHELGHLGTLKLVGGEIDTFFLTAFGGELRIQNSERLSYGQELLSVLAGPLVNLICAFSLAYFFRGELVNVIVGIHLILAFYNLLPLRFLDGGRILYLILCWLTEPISADRWIHGITCLTLVLGISGITILQWKIGLHMSLTLAEIWLILCWGMETGIVKRKVYG